MDPVLIITHGTYTTSDLAILLIGLVFLFTLGKVAGRIQERGKRRKWLRTLLRTRITPWHVGQMSPVAMSPDELRFMGESIIDHLLADNDQYLVPQIIDLGENVTPRQVESFRQLFEERNRA